MLAILCLRKPLSSKWLSTLIATPSGSVLPHLLLSVAFALTQSVPVLAQGFGGRASEVRITRRLPPKIHLGGESFSVEVTSAQQVSPQVVGLVGAKIAGMITSKNHMLAAVESGADTSITCFIQSLHSSSRATTWTTTEYQKTGQHTVHDDATNTDQTVDDYGYVTVSHYGTLVEGDISAWYEVTDRASGTVLDSAQLGQTYSQTFEGGGNNFDPFADLAVALANQIASRLTPASETIVLALPKGQLKAAGKLFAEGLWDQALDRLTNTPPLKRAEDDAYRIYMIGVVKEWLGYYATDPARARDLINQSIAAYGTARSMKPREPVFADAAGRAAAAASEYSTFLDQARALQALQSKVIPPHPAQPAQTPGQQAGRTPPAAPSGGIQSVPVSSTYYSLSNDTILAWLSLALPEREIVARIKASRQNAFDLSPGALYELRQAGAGDAVIQAMLKQQQHPRRAGATVTIITLALSAMMYLPWILR